MIRHRLCALLLVLCALTAFGQTLQGTAFTYQGLLSQAGTPLEGSVDLVFKLFDAPNDGNQIGPTLEFTAANGNPLVLANGVFDAALDFGSSAFNGLTTDQRFLEVSVNGSVLQPRTPIQNAPYALQSQTAELAYAVTNGSIGMAQIDATQVQRRVGGTCASGSSISSVNQDGSVNCQSAGNGTITGVLAGSGLSGGGTSGSVTLSADTNFVQERVTGTCASGSAVRTIAADGSVTCQTAGAGTITGVTAGNGLNGGGTSGNVTLGLAVPLALSGSAAYPAAVISATDTGSSDDAVAMFGTISSDGVAIYGASSSNTGYGRGVEGDTSSPDGIGVFGDNEATTGEAIGVWGGTSSPTGIGVIGTGATSGTTTGILGEMSSPDGIGVHGRAVNSDGTALGAGTGVEGESDSGVGVVGVSTTTAGVYGAGATGVYGVSTSSVGFGLDGYSSSSTGSGRGVYGQSEAPGSHAVEGYSGSGVGIYGATSSGYAGYFAGNVHVQGTLSKTAGSFQIDHPLDPANKYLFHSFVESPDMKNIYDGIATLDARGQAWVEMPDYFEALNQDFRYQLTALDAPAPSLYVAQRISGNRFQLAGGQAFQQVSWQVTGTRKDAYAAAHRIQVEVDKPADERGKYLYPALFGAPESMAVHPASQVRPSPPALPAFRHPAAQ